MASMRRLASMSTQGKAGMADPAKASELCFRTFYCLLPYLGLKWLEVLLISEKAERSSLRNACRRRWTGGGMGGKGGVVLKVGTLTPPPASGRGDFVCPNYHSPLVSPPRSNSHSQTSRERGA
jgi:hypothetical protein